MPLLSAFTPLGALRLTRRPSEVEKIYRSMIGSLGPDNYAVTKGSREDAWCYAWARTLATVRLTLIHAGLQISPSCVYEYLADRETEWQIVPGPNDTILQRRATLAARKILPRGARREAVVDALQTLLGDAFVWYRTTHPDEIATWPSAAGGQPMNLQLPTVERKRLVITQPISFGLGSPQVVSYAMADASQPTVLVNDKLVIDPGSSARAELVTVAAVDVATGKLTATFENPHDNRTIGITSPFPAWSSNQRYNLIVTSAAAAVDPETRRKVNELCERILRGVSTWGIVQATSATTAGPFLVGVSPIGATPFGTVTWP